MEDVQKWSFAQRQAAQAPAGEEDTDLKRGPWTVDEDLILVDYIAKHGEGRWNSLARCAGLKRTGKSCRLRWLNYLRPDVRRGNITPEEQLLILELHSRWGNRWSKIAQYLPGRTDNEIKNYWRTRVQKHAKQLKCDVDSKKFKDAMRYLWMPRLVERIRAAASNIKSSTGAAGAAPLTPTSSTIINGSMQASGNDKALTSPGSPLEGSDVDDPSVITGVAGSSAGTRMPSPASSVYDCFVVDCYPAAAQVARGDHAASPGFMTSDDRDTMQDDVVWVKSSLLSTVPQSSEDQGTSMDHLQQQLDRDDCGGDIFVDKFWSFEDIWSMEEDIF